MVDSLYKNDFRKTFEGGKNLPRISTVLDSVRTYQFEIQFFGLPPDVAGSQTDLTLAAKQVSPVGISVDDIEVRRVNDKVFYPGAPSQEEITITFDNLYFKETSPALWRWFKSIYNPLTGDMTELSAPGAPGNKTFKATKMRIIELDNTRTPHAVNELYGVYPKSFRFAERNYSAGSDFHTLEVSFRWDFMDYYKYSNQNQ
jgi:hypothetical protein